MKKGCDRIAAVRSLIVAIKYIGLWPFTNEYESFGWLKRNYRYLLHIPLSFTYIILMWVEALKSENFEEAGQTLYISIAATAAILKVVHFWIKTSLAWKFMDSVKNDPLYNLRSSEEWKFWNDEQNIFKRIFFFYISGSLTVAASGYISVLMVSEYQLPFSYYIPFDWRNSHYYWYAYGYNVIAMTLTCASNIVLDTLACYFLFHTSLLHRLLGIRLENLREISEKDAILELRIVFRMYMKLHRLSKQCEELVSMNVLSQIVLSALIICFSGYRLLQVGPKSDSGQFIVIIQFLIVMTLQIFLPCYYGNEVSYYSNRLTTNVYNTNWEQFSPSTRKLLNLYMEFLKKSNNIKAGNFFVIGLPIFVKTINNAYSFFAVLLNLMK